MIPGLSSLLFLFPPRLLSFWESIPLIVHHLDRAAAYMLVLRGHEFIS